MAHNDDCTVLSAAFPDGERITLTAGELKRLIRMAAEGLPPQKPPKADEEPKKGSRR